MNISHDFIESCIKKWQKKVKDDWKLHGVMRRSPFFIDAGNGLYLQVLPDNWKHRTWWYKKKHFMGKYPDMGIEDAKAMVEAGKVDVNSR